MGEGHTDRNTTWADSKEPAKGFREAVAQPHTALITSMERLGQELTATVSLVTAQPCQDGGISTLSPAHPKPEVTGEDAAQGLQRNSAAMSPIQNRRGRGPSREGLKWGSGLSCFQTAPQNQQPTHLPAQPGKGHLQKSANLNGLKTDRRSYSSAPSALHPIEYKAPHGCLMPNLFLPRCQRWNFPYLSRFDFLSLLPKISATTSSNTSI